MKKLLSFALCLLPFVFIGHASAEGAYYIVSAYYSPKPNQDFYLHGSYQEEISVNGKGITTSSGKPVKIGAIAAPQEIAFNTRVHIKQTILIKGVDYDFDFNGTVMDRGGAIHSKSGLPRLDIYMGEGQVGLCRALNFGVQTLYVSMDSDTSKPDTSDFSGISSECSNPHDETVPLASGGRRAFDPFTMTIGASSPKEDIQAVQTLLNKINAYTGPIDGVFDDDFVEAIYQFQRSEGIVKSRIEDGAGNYGPKTRAMLRVLTSGEANKSTPIITRPAPTTTPTTTPSSPTTTPLPQNDTSVDTQNLQQMLKDLGYFKFEVDGVYNKRLVDSIFAFQVAKNIVENDTDPGAGYYGPVTRETLEGVHATWQAKHDEIVALESKIDTEKERIAAEREEKKKEFVATLEKIPQAKLGAVDPQIRVLQKILKEQGFMTAKDTATFGPITRTALGNYQIKLGLIPDLRDVNMGKLGPRTKAAIAEDLFQKWVKTDLDREIPVTNLMEELEALKKS